MNFYNKPCEDAVNIQPINDILLIRRIEVVQPKSAGGILLPPVEESASTPWRGVVVAAGPGKPVKLSSVGEGMANALRKLLDANKAEVGRHDGPRGINLTHWQDAADAMAAHDDSVPRIPMQVQVGDTVIFSKNGYQEYKIDGETLLAMGQDSILGVLDDAIKEYDSKAAQCSPMLSTPEDQDRVAAEQDQYARYPRCTNALRAAGKSYPRTCAECGLGPCKAQK